MYLERRNRILRQSQSVRSLVAETHLTPNDFIVPLFIDEGENVKTEISSMPNYYRRSLDLTVEEVKVLWSMFHSLALVKIKNSSSKHFFETLFQIALIHRHFAAESFNGDGFADMLDQNFSCLCDLFAICFIGQEFTIDHIKLFLSHHGSTASRVMSASNV